MVKSGTVVDVTSVKKFGAYVNLEGGEEDSSTFQKSQGST